VCEGEWVFGAVIPPFMGVVSMGGKGLAMVIVPRYPSVSPRPFISLAHQIEVVGGSFWGVSGGWGCRAGEGRGPRPPVSVMWGEHNFLLLCAFQGPL